jgi:cytochrome P450
VYPEHQIAIHADLDAHFGSLPKEQWTQEKDFQALQKTHLGAVLKEVLRLYNVIQFIFRFTVAPTTVHDSKGIPHVIPAGTTCLINYAAAFQNPGIWPQKSGISKERRAELHNSPAIDFDPGHWLDRGDEELDENYWPFGYGGRKCPGMPFAQVEMVAVLATLLKEYSVELVVSEEALNRCAGDPKKAWEQTRDQAIRQLGDDVEANLTIQMVKELPIRLVKRTR